MIAVTSATQNNHENSTPVIQKDQTGVAPQSLLERIASLKLRDDKTIKIAPLKSFKINPNKAVSQVYLPQGVVEGRVSKLVKRIDSKKSNSEPDHTGQEEQQNLDPIANIRKRTGQRDWDNFDKK